MAFLGAAVVRGAGNALVIMDLPFGSYEASDEQCVRTASCPFPTVGIDAGAGTDAQVLVWHDMADIPAGDHRAKFVRKFGSVGADLAAAAADYKRAVHTGEFPGPEHTF